MILDYRVDVAGPPRVAGAARLGAGIINRLVLRAPSVGAGVAEGLAAGGVGRRFHPDRLVDHFERHGGDFGARTAAEYEQMADRFLTGPRPEGVLERVRPNGDVVRFDPSTDAFGVVSQDGTIRTFYRPDPAVHGRATNLEYFNAQ